ncbi:MAG: peptidylprolyl isomerase [Clostridia bacterium]|nr:peptidylprolyl isomerase [Clostridia bacterium]
MRHTLVKLMGLLVALTLALTGCNLIGIDPMMQLDEDFAKAAKDFSTVVAEYDGGTVTKGDVMGSFANNYAYYSQMYSMFGMSLTSDVVENIKQQSLEDEIQGIAVEKELAARGLSLSDEKVEEIKTTAESNYQQAYDSYYESAEGKGDVKARQTEYNMYINGLSKETFEKLQRRQEELSLIEETVEGEISELTDEQLQAAYDEKVSDDESAYAEDAGSFESAMASEDDLVAWMPEGYRTVKHILVKPDDTVLNDVTDARDALDEANSTLEGYQEELDALNDDDAEPAAEEAAEGEDAEATEEEAEADEARTAEEIQADIDAATAEVEAARKAVEEAEAKCLESVKAKTDEIYAKLAEGAEFSDLIAEYGEDPGMQNEPTATRGYYVSSKSENWDKNFTAGAMALANVGDVSETPVISTSGVHIIRYESDVTPGAVPLDDIRDALYETTLETAKHEHYEEALEGWTTALNPVYHADAFTLG